MSARYRELIVEWITDLGQPFTIDELANHFDIHYQTAWKYVRGLTDTGILDKVDDRRLGTRNDLYSLAGSDEITPEQALRIRFGNDNLTLAEWACGNLENADIPKIAHGMMYLFVRSYYADAPDHQHLRGIHDPVQVRSFIADKLKELKKSVRAIEEMLSYRLPFDEGSKLAQRFGNPPVGFDQTQALTKAEIFSGVLKAEIESKRSNTTNTKSKESE